MKLEEGKKLEQKYELDKKRKIAERHELLAERYKLTTYLRWGDAALIARMAGVTRQTVERYLRGEVFKSSIEPYVIKVSEKRKIELDKAMERLTVQS